LRGDLGVPDWVPVAANDDWDIQAIQPELNLPLPHDGFLDGLKLVKNPSLQGYFYLDFIWRGQGTPGKQDYEFFAINDLDEFIITQSGQTQPFPGTTIPEPEILLLMLIGLGGLVTVQRTHYKSKKCQTSH
jgi:hypothetical protein